MAQMIRKQVYIEPRQEELLKRRARELGVSEAELIRRGIDLVSRAPVRLPPDRQAWKEFMAFIQEHRQMDVPQTGRTWTREELYDERLERYSR
ncbi:MAG: hypothetical protein HY331_06235 [Chloroflexi bacterium]|nr:hypothetical protein [Chloroflexota bacterium]